MAEKLDPTNQAHIDEFAKKYSAGFDEIEKEFENSESSRSYEELRANLDADFNNAIENLEAEKNSAPGTEKGLNAGKKIKIIKKLREDLFKIIDRPEFKDYREKKPKIAKGKRGLNNAQRLTDYARVILMNSKKMLDAKKSIDELEDVKLDAMNSILELSKKAPTMQAILKDIRGNVTREAEEKKEKEEADKAMEEAEKAAEEAARIKAEEDKKAQEEADKAAEAAKAKNESEAQKEEPEKEYIDFANKFLDKGVSFYYRKKRMEKSWTGYNDEVLGFLKFQFEELAKKSLGNDAVKIEKSWQLIVGSVQGKVEAIEEEIKNEKSSGATNIKEEYMKLTPEEVLSKLDAAGASEEDKNYFFNLDLQGRINFLMCSEEELREKIKNLKEQREAGKQTASQEDLETDQEKKDAALKESGDNVKNARNNYLQKEYEFNKITSRLKRIFRKDKIDMGNTQKDLEEDKERYQEAIKKYIEVIIHNEGINDEEEREIMYRYLKFGETLQVMDAKEDIKFQNHPYLEAMKRDFSVGALSFVDKYKELIGKPKELIAKKTDSKILSFGGGMIAVGGAMAFAASYVPGIRGITRALSIAVATKGFYEKAENKAVIEKEESLEKGVTELEKRLAYIDGLGADINEAFKKELGLSAENILDEVKKEKEAVGKRMALSLVKAIAVSSVFYEAGKIAGGFFGGGEMQDSEIKSQTIPAHGNNLHSQFNYPNNSGIEIKNPIVQNKEEVYNALKELEKKSAVADSGTGVQVEAEKNSSVQPEKTATPSAENGAPEVQLNDYKGIKLNELRQGEIKVIEGMGIKDTIASLLARNYENLTAGKMGWDPDKYASLEEWADRRAVGIVAELKAQHPEYDYDKVSLESKITLDMKNPADIKITNFVDGQKIDSDGAGSNTYSSEHGTLTFDKEENETGIKWKDEGINEKSGDEAFSNESKLSPEQEAKENGIEFESGENNDSAGVGVEKSSENISSARDAAAKQEVQFAYRLGIAPNHYAQINDIKVSEFITEIKRVDSIVHGGGEDSVDIDKSSKLPSGSILGNGEASNKSLGRVLNYLMQDGKITNPNQTIAETFRNVSQNDLLGALRTYEGIFGNISSGDAEIVMEMDENKMYSEYVSTMIKTELADMLSKNYGEGKIMRELAALRGVPMKDLSDSELMMAFREATKQSVGDLAHQDNETAGKYVLNVIRKAYEAGTMDKLRDSIARINTVNPVA